MNKIEVVQTILTRKSRNPCQRIGRAFAPTNIALCKYWGKRNTELNLPMTASLSVSLGIKGATTEIQESYSIDDQIQLNGQGVDLKSAFGQRLSDFLDLFRPSPAVRYEVKTDINIPVAAGLASSACGFAALVLALNELYGWKLDKSGLSILARLGSGSAARSLWQGFVEWKAGEMENGMDSYGIHLAEKWSALRVGLHILDTQQKPLSSREAMHRTVLTSKLYSVWPVQVSADMQALKTALASRDFALLGQVSESNALAMHATMTSAWPPVMYAQPETVAAMHAVWRLRADGVPVYFTQDAGPNLKLLFESKTYSQIKTVFPNLEVCAPFA